LCLEQLASEVMGGVRAGASERQFSGVRFRIGDQFGDIADRQRTLDHETDWQFGGERQRCEVGGRIVGRIPHQHGPNGQGGGRSQQYRRAVRLGAGNGQRRERATAARPVLDDDRLLDVERKRVTHGAAEDIGSAARRERREDLDRPRGPVLR
jgi:hypothetical protein